MVFQSLCFWLKHAPGNASIGSSHAGTNSCPLLELKNHENMKYLLPHTGGGLVGVKFWVVLLSLTFHVLPDS